MLGKIGFLDGVEALWALPFHAFLSRLASGEGVGESAQAGKGARPHPGVYLPPEPHHLSFSFPRLQFGSQIKPARSTCPKSR